jgi:dTDP-4-dehydrorhamnose 3,5-epimerase
LDYFPKCHIVRYVIKKLKLDGTVTVAAGDVQTVTSTGARVESRIDGVKTFSPVNHVDHRGRVFEIFPGENEFWTDPVVYCYGFTVRSSQVKGWGLHQEKDDRYTLIDGEVLTVLYDSRLDSNTYGVVQKVTLTPQGIRQLLIPTGVWHMNLNIGTSEAFLINHPTEVYHHQRPDRLLLPWNAPEIPVELLDYMPVQLNGATFRECN